MPCSNRLTLALVVLAVALAASSVPASAACEKSVVVRKGSDGREQPHRVVRCDENERPALLEGNAHLTLCDPKALAASGARFEDCAGAVDAARTALRKAKIRAALRDGADAEEIAERYGASESELEALRPVEVAP
jgi:hypothetical protein